MASVNGVRSKTILGAYIGHLEFYGEFVSSGDRSGFIEMFNTETGDSTIIADYKADRSSWFGTWRALTIAGNDEEADRDYKSYQDYMNAEAAYEAEQDRQLAIYYESRGW